MSFADAQPLTSAPVPAPSYPAVVRLLPLLLLTGCASWDGGRMEAFPNIAVCLFASCSIQSRDTAGQGQAEIKASGEVDQKSAPANSTTVPIPPLK